jgi:outer membrane murein-binding lipoprotein Lpp
MTRKYFYKRHMDMHSTARTWGIPSSAVLLSALILGCATYPLGLSREQWDALSPEQQAEYQAKQYQIDAERRARAEEARQQAAEREAERVRLEAERLRQAYANAQYRDIVTVSVQGGFLSYAGKNYPYEPAAFDLIKGETKKVFFRGRGMQTVATEYAVRLSDDGNTVFFDDESRSRAVLVNRDWERGETYRPSGTVNDVSVGLSGMTFFIKYKAISGSPQRVIIENR